MNSIVHIDGMRSVHCVRAVFTALGGVPGIVRAEVTMGRADLTHDAALQPSSVAHAIAQAGYAVRAVERDARRLPLLPDGAAPDGGVVGA